MRSQNKMKTAIKLACFALVILGLVFTLHGAKTPLKAYVSQALIDYAWAESQKQQAPVKPWPWMDSAPVAKIEIPKLGQSQVVLSGISGAVMAFAPGWHEGTSTPGESGVSLISAHRDTHFASLRNIQPGDRIDVEVLDGARTQYTVKKVSIIDKPSLNIAQNQSARILILSTCYPFSNWQVGGDMRFVVIAEAVELESQSLAGLSLLP